MDGIRIEGADYAVQDVPILTGIDLHLTERRIGILGRNGSGKSTLLRLIAGLIAPTAGHVTVDGADPTDRRAALRALGILFQNPDHQIIFPTVEEELAFGLRQMGHPAREAEAQVRAVLTAEGRTAWAGRLVHTLSHGQKQYLCLLAILMMGPRTILLDEPFAALDLPSRIALRRRLAALPQRLITITHDPEAVMECDRVLWLEGGRIQDDGPPARLLPAFVARMEHLAGDAL
ncbi:energy-coupling factor ABC transporter ATP-binding protein [Falsirhodobacter halotolerans]|uniref:energy-coupling factor ABC transporter ATP-binding protein n=1 Tax=Falsirhodobacter halotolerans TaxID=1146892 RepID=UPI001FD2FE43|nr:ABC transporter ATP-binding protein [Falsirhodobacter halotolerans]MCJ8138856.1 energy-coupling factor ABC transporter ATP-binding protein [Falsirhodobacter halotolerans]